nr:hypothetical protein [Tanacetum cinerariifolium]
MNQEHSNQMALLQLEQQYQFHNFGALVVPGRRIRTDDDIEESNELFQNDTIPRPPVTAVVTETDIKTDTTTKNPRQKVAAESPEKLSPPLSYRNQPPPTLNCLCGHNTRHSTLFHRKKSMTSLNRRRR